MPATLSELRREPRQQRSLQLIERALDATDALLAAEDIETLTTTRIAAAAGVSVGALYQYFPDRDAIIAAVARRHIEASNELMAKAVAEAGSAGWKDPVGALVDMFAARYRQQPGYRALWLGPHLTERLRAADRAGKEILAEGVRSIIVGLGIVPDDERTSAASRAAVYACDALLQEAFRRDPAGDARMLEEAEAMLRGYLGQLATSSEQGSVR